jgi:tight adherence protein C
VRLFGAALVAMAFGVAVVAYQVPGRVRSASKRARRAVIGNRRRESTMASLAAGVLGLGLVTVRPNPSGVIAACAVTAAGWQLPLIRARSVEEKRRRRLDLELSDALGEMVMGVEAGLTLEAVMNLYAQAHESNLAAEFNRVLDLIKLGSTRTAALEEFRSRTPTVFVSTFVSAVQQNQRLGTPLAAVLRQQGRTARRRRQQAVEEHAAKLSLKMIFPTVLCILPVLFIVIVGPAVIRVIQSWPQ